ncbi:MAG: VWA domain-containing protein [Acidobacteriota bacterium]
MPEIALTHPKLLALALAPLALFAARWFRGHQSRPSIGTSGFAWLPPARREPRLLLRLGSLSGLLCLLCLVGLLAGPTVIRRAAVPEVHAGALVIVLDISSSMTADDFAPRNRLEEAKAHLEEFIQSSPDWDFGLIQFAAVPTLLAPVTTDRGAVVEALRSIAPAGAGADGTAIGSALASAVNRLRGGPWGRRRALLITDGVNNRGNISPLDAARLARVFGIEIAALGIGTDALSRFWVQGRQGEPAQVEARIEIDNGALESIAAETGGAYRRVRASAELGEALAEMARADEQPALRPVLHRDPAPQLLLAVLALVLLGIEFIITHFLHAELPG